MVEPDSTEPLELPTHAFGLYGGKRPHTPKPPRRQYQDDWKAVRL